MKLLKEIYNTKHGEMQVGAASYVAAPVNVHTQRLPDLMYPSPRILGLAVIILSSFQRNQNEYGGVWSLVHL